MLTKNELYQLLHDLKRAGKAVKLIKDEKDEEKRTLIANLIIDELDRLYEDLIKVTEKT